MRALVGVPVVMATLLVTAPSASPKIAPRPILFIHAGTRDVGTLTPEYYEAARAPKEIWEVPEGGHTGGIDARPREYERRVVRFLDGALLG